MATYFFLKERHCETSEVSPALITSRRSLAWLLFNELRVTNTQLWLRIRL